MRLRINVIGLLTIVLAGVLFVGIRKTMEDEPVQDQGLSVRIGMDEHVETIRIWENTEDDCFIFLPSYARMEQVYLIPGDTCATLDGVNISEVISCENFELNQKYPFSYMRDGVPFNTTLTFVQSCNIPSIHIDTYSENMDYIHEKKGNEESGLIRVYTNEGELNCTGGLDFIKGRGNSTWDMPKKPYSLKLSFSADLLNMGSAEKWILLAEAYDASNLRNKIGLDLARNAGMEYTPECRWVDLYLNEEYAGLYLLTERNEIHAQRVNISYSDSFLVAIERGDRLAEQEYPYISTENDTYIRIHYSSMNDDELTKIWQSIENAILAEDSIDPVSGKHLEELIDVDSWLMRLLVDEVMANFDGGSISQFFYYDAAQGAGKVKAGPVWDLDNTLRAGEGFFKDPKVIAAHREHVSWDTELQMFAELYKKEEVRERLVEFYREIFLPLVEKLVDTDIQQYIKYISSAANMNRIRWDMMDPETEAEDIRLYLKQRIDFLNEYWLSDTEYHLVYLVQEDWPWDCLAVRHGENIPDIMDTTEGWHIIGTEEPFDFSQPIYEDVTIVLGYVDFQEEKERYDDVIPTEETKDDSEDMPWPKERVAPAIMFFMFLLSVCLIDFLRTSIWKRKGERKK